MGVALPVLDCIRQCHANPPPSWDSSAYNLIGRNDITKTLDSAELTKPPLMMRGDDSEDGMNLDLEVRRGVV